MKERIKLLCLIALAICVIANANASITYDNYVSKVFKNVFIQMPSYRETKSGTKLVVTYEGDWPAEMQGAFDYAIKLWEEVLPLSAPINITAKIGPLRKSTALTSVVAESYEFDQWSLQDYWYSKSMVKCVALKEHHADQYDRFYSDINDVSYLDQADIVITYNEEKLSDFSFSLDGELLAPKYDFVTCAMRDIAIGLGFTTNFLANKSAKRINDSGRRLSHFENIVWTELGGRE